MAGDLDVVERIVVSRARKLDHAAAGGPGATPPPRALHQYGRIQIVADGHGPVEGAAAAEHFDEGQLQGIDATERFGLDALRLRESPAFQQVKLARPRAGEVWDMPFSCTDVGPQPHLPGPAGAAAPGEAGAPAPAGPTSSFLEGSVAVGIIIVEGPTADLQFSQAERTKVVAEVQNGLSWLAAANPAAGITFTYDIHVVSITTPPNPTAPDLEALWRDPAMAALGYSADWAGVTTYVNAIRTNLGTRWTYCGYFTKYPVGHFAYASIGGPRIVMQYSNDGWGPDNIDRVFTHETGHIFGCPDEYASSGCTCGGSWGRFGTPNANCENCAPGGGVSCLMRANDWSLCGWTPSHLGWATNVAGNPALIQSRFGQKGNFELVAPSAYAGFDFMWRNNDSPTMPWSAPGQFGQRAGRIDGLAMIQSNYGSPGNLELIARTGDTLQFFWRDSGPTFTWNGPFQIATGAAGNPSFIQSRFGQKGNFELVYPGATGGLRFMWRNNDSPTMPWSAPVSFGTSIGQVQGVCLIQSNYGSPGNLELIARAGDKLYFFWRDSGPTFTWNGPFQIATGAAGNPSFIQSRFGQKGNFELVYPGATGGLRFMWRNNDSPTMPWSAPVSFAASLGQVQGVCLIQSNYGSPGNLELIANAGGRLNFLWRDSGPTFTWNGPWRIL